MKSFPWNFSILCLLSGILASAVTGVSTPEWSDKPTWPGQPYYDEDGPPVVLECNVKNIDEVKILWFKNKELISGKWTSWSLSNNNQTLTLDPPKQTQTGNYECFVNAAAGNISHSGYILIAGRSETIKPRIIQTSPKNRIKHADIGENVTIWCLFDIGGSKTGLLDFTMDWVKNRTLVNDTNHSTWDEGTTSDNSQIFYLNITNLTSSDYGEYECVGSNSAGNDTKIFAVLPPKPYSGPDHTWIIVLCSVGTLFVLGSVAMVTMLYRKRRSLSKYEQFDWPEADLEQYDVPKVDLQYDVFVSYSSGDQDWVLNSLFGTMTSHSYEVCIDFKDFTPGMAISENILDAIYKSRKVIVVLSQNFMKSVWGQFELSQALNRAVIQRKDVLILIKYDSCKVPGKLMGRTFLDWTSSDVRPHFFKRLFESVGEPGNYRNIWNQSSEKQDGGQSEKNCGKQNGKEREGQKDNNQNDCQCVEKSDKGNGSDIEDSKKDIAETQRKNSTSKGIERSVSYTKNEDSVDNENVMNFLEREAKLVDINTDGNFNSTDSEMGRLIRNQDNIIDIHAPVIQI